MSEDQNKIIPFDGCSDEPDAAPKPRQKFDPIPIGQFSGLSNSGWRIKNVLPLSELVVIFGPSGCGKTFLTFTMMMHIAQGLDWYGHRTKPGKVVYIAAESAPGLRKRAYAYAERHGLDLNTVTNFEVIPDCPDIFNTQDATTIASKIKTADVIVIDTFSRVIPGGNENDGKDVGKAIGQCQLLHKLTGALIILVHHTGKNVENGARGWSGLKAALDMEMSVEKLDGNHVATITKMKDGEEGERFGFTLDHRILGQDTDGDDITSCVFEPMDEAPKKSERQLANGKWQRYAMAAFEELYKPTVASFVHIDHLITKTAEKALQPDGDKRDRRREYAMQGIEALIEGGKLVKTGNSITRA